MDTLALFLPVFKFVAASALLALFYLLLYREKSTYTHARIFLLSIVLVSLLVSQFQIEVFTPPVRVVEVVPKPSVTSAVLSVGGKSESQSVSKEEPLPVANPTMMSDDSSTMQPASSFAAVASEKQSESMEQSGWLKSLTIPQMAGLIYLLVTAFLFGLLVVQLFRILSIRYRGERKSMDGYTVIVHPAVPTPFSFLTFIFVGTNLSGSKLDIIIKHESWHIRHRHYIDAIAIELLVRIFWFNPVLWWVRKELRNIDEFQTDRSLLDDGQEIYQYQTTLLEEVMEGNPYLANGFNSSFIKKRFIIMKNKSKIRFTKIRQAMIVPYVAILFALFSFTTGKAEVRYVEKPAAEAEAMMLPDTSYVKKSPNGMDITYTIKTNVVDTAAFPSMAAMTEKSIVKSIDSVADQLTVMIDALKEIKKSGGANEMNGKKLLGLLNIQFNGQGVEEMTPGMSEALKKSFEGVDLDKSINNLTQIRKDVLMIKTAKSSPMEKGVAMSSQVMKIMQDELFSNLIGNIMPVMMESLMGGMQTMMEGLGAKNGNEMGKITKALMPFANMVDADDAEEADEAAEVEDAEDAEEMAVDTAVFVSYLPSEKAQKVKISTEPYQQGTMRLLYIDKQKEETRVTLLWSIDSQSHWYQFDDVFSIIDKKTGDQYRIRSIEGNYPLNKRIQITGHQGKMVEFTLVFPPLKSSVKKVDIMDVTDNLQSINAGPNNGKVFGFGDVEISKYKKPAEKKGVKIYK
jgi:hypothetical protein